MFLYPVTLKRDQEGGFVATFKDIPEAITQGETKHEALAAAKDALETALDFYFEDNRAVPLHLDNPSLSCPPASPPKFCSSTR
jgi:predicted RNase H-like HicB family nuclease